MSEQRMPVDGPFRLYAEAIPAGATLDVASFVESVVHDVVELLLTDEYGDRLDELAEAQPADPHEVQRPSELRFESLVADLVDATSTKIPVYGAQVLRLAEALRKIAVPKPVPTQRTEGGAAA